MVEDRMPELLKVYENGRKAIIYERDRGFHNARGICVNIETGAELDRVDFRHSSLALSNWLVLDTLQHLFVGAAA